MCFDLIANTADIETITPLSWRLQPILDLSQAIFKLALRADRNISYKILP
jgi:hypothetical protein